MHVWAAPCFPEAVEKDSAGDGVYSDKQESERPFVVSFPLCRFALSGASLYNLVPPISELPPVNVEGFRSFQGSVWF